MHGGSPSPRHTPRHQSAQPRAGPHSTAPRRYGRGKATRTTRARTLGSHPTLVATFSSTTSVYADAGLSNGVTYYYVVLAFDGTSEGASSTGTFVVLVDNVLPEPPTALTARGAAGVLWLSEGGVLDTHHRGGVGRVAAR